MAHTKLRYRVTVLLISRLSLSIIPSTTSLSRLSSSSKRCGPECSEPEPSLLGVDFLLLSKSSLSILPLALRLGLRDGILSYHSLAIIASCHWQRFTQYIEGGLSIVVAFLRQQTIRMMTTKFGKQKGKSITRIYSHDEGGFYTPIPMKTLLDSYAYIQFLIVPCQYSFSTHRPEACIRSSLMQAEKRSWLLAIDRP